MICFNDNSLSLELALLKERQENLTNTAVCSQSLKSKLLKILPSLSATNNEMESLLDVDATATPLTSELFEKLVDEFVLMKTAMNSVELQLYEANEKISELMENVSVAKAFKYFIDYVFCQQHQHLEEENESLRTENINLTKVAKLLTENMKESVETSKKCVFSMVLTNLLTLFC